MVMCIVGVFQRFGNGLALLRLVLASELQRRFGARVRITPGRWQRSPGPAEEASGSPEPQKLHQSARGRRGQKGRIKNQH